MNQAGSQSYMSAMFSLFLNAGAHVSPAAVAVCLHQRESNSDWRHNLRQIYVVFLPEEVLQLKWLSRVTEES